MTTLQFFQSFPNIHIIFTFICVSITILVLLIIKKILDVLIRVLFGDRELSIPIIKFIHDAFLIVIIVITSIYEIVQYYFLYFN